MCHMHSVTNMCFFFWAKFTNMFMLCIPLPRFTFLLPIKNENIILPIAIANQLYYFIIFTDLAQ